jgi:hypothetical protein
MPLDGRMEKRVPSQIPAYLMRFSGPRAVEKVVTENVSPRGACVITGRSCQPGEEVQLSVLACEFRLSARVIYCLSSSSTSFCVGLEYKQPSACRLLIPKLLPSLVS